MSENATAAAPEHRWIGQLDLPTDEGGYCFNPTIFRSPLGLVCIYRHVDRNGTRSLRRCRLYDDFTVRADFFVWSQESRALGGDVAWYADPRAFKWNDRFYVTFNTGDLILPSNIYIVEVSEDGRPLSAPIKLVKTDGRQQVEKNWGFFEHDGELYALYSLSPFIVLRVELCDGEAHARIAEVHHWQSDVFDRAFGAIRGGASPIRFGDTFYVVAQSHISTPDGLEYTGTLLSFEAKPPFRPLALSPEPLFPLTPAEYRLQPYQKLNPRVAACLYPCGADVLEDSALLTVTYGINDFRSGVRVYRFEELQKFLCPILVREPLEETSKGQSDTLRTFFWQPQIAQQGNPSDLDQSIFRFGNAGDALQALIAAKLFGARTLNDDLNGKRVLGVGSIAHRMRAGDILWGCGFKEIAPKVTREEAATVRALAVRGPLTRDYLARHGVDVSHLETFFDPGLLLAEMFPQQIEILRNAALPPSGVLYLPHYRDQSRFEELYGREGLKVGTMDCDVFNLCRSILEAELVVASSLHGIIFAEALGRPAILHRPPPEEFSLKYEDYYLGTQRDTFPIFEESDSAAKCRPAPLPPIPANWRASLPDRRILRAEGVLFSEPLSLQVGQ